VLYDTGATIGQNTSSHIHIGSNLINTPEKLSLLLKTLVVFEPIIFKFGYGYLDKPRDFLTSRAEHSIFSPMMTPKRVSLFTDELDHYNHGAQGVMRAKFLDFVKPDLRFRPVFNFKDFDFSKIHYGIEMDEPNTSDHFEVRCFNGTLRPEIAQNNINLITSIVAAVLNGKIDENYIKKEYDRYKKKRYNFDTFCAILYDEDKVAQYNRLLNGFGKVKLEKALNATVIKISALKNTGINHLIQHIRDDELLDSTNPPIFDQRIEEEIESIKAKLSCDNKRFVAVKMLERDEFIKEDVDCSKSIENLERIYDMDTEQIIANGRYEFIEKIKKQAVVNVNLNKETFSDKLDKIFLNKYAAIPLFVVIMAMVYFLSVGVVGSATVDLIDGFITGTVYDAVSNWLSSINASDWAVSLVCDGIISGVGAVLNFVPQLMILFLLLSVLETSGYMSRITFFLDKVFRRFGLSGKSLIPFIVGSGCSVPGIMTTRTIENKEEKDLTAMNLAELKEMAKIKGIKGYSKMKKDELIEVLK
jgi:hypothetical protein